MSFLGGLEGSYSSTFEGGCSQTADGPLTRRAGAEPGDGHKAKRLATGLE